MNIEPCHVFQTPPAHHSWFIEELKSSFLIGEGHRSTGAFALLSAVGVEGVVLQSLRCHVYVLNTVHTPLLSVVNKELCFLCFKINNKWYHDGISIL